MKKTKDYKMISKKLLSLVLGEPLDYIRRISHNTKSLIWRDTDESLRPIGDSIHEINLDTLGRLCKEWCMEQGYEFMSCAGNYSCGKHKGLCMLHEDVNRDYTSGFTATTEPEAIIAATTWVAKEKGLL